MEVVLALAIASMLATLAVPYFRPTAGNHALIASANAIASLLRRDRNMALHLQRSSLVLIDAKRGSMQSTLLAQGIVLPDDITLGIVPENARGVAFATDGSASGARIILATQHRSLAIDVNRLTAAISVSGLKQ